MALSLTRVARFVRTYWLWVLALPPLVLVAELVHGAVELLAISAQGGGLVELGSFGPGRFSWLIGFSFERGRWFDPLVAYLAPFVVWIWVAALGSYALTILERSRAARWTIVTCGFLPMASISTALALGTAARSSLCLLSVVQREPLAPSLIAAAAFVVFGLTTWRHFRRVWGGLSALEFALGYCALLATPWLIVFA